MSGFTRCAATMVLVFSAVSLLLAETPTGVIKGTVTDRDTREPLLGANVMVAGTKLGAATNENGEFLIKGVPAGIRILEVRLVGYQGITLTDISVSPDRSAQAMSPRWGPSGSTRRRFAAHRVPPTM